MKIKVEYSGKICIVAIESNELECLMKVLRGKTDGGKARLYYQDEEGE